MKENKDNIKQSIERFKYEIINQECDFPVIYPKKSDKTKQKVLKKDNLK